MKENKYDKGVFFEKYSEMSRSKEGLSGAGEWKEFERLLPSFEGKRVLDLGCGYGWHCGYAVEQGADSVVGLDISRKMLEKAKEINASPKIEYRQTAIEDVDYPAGSFDIVISSLAFHYVKDYQAVIKKISELLRKGGFLIFTVEHPVFTAHGKQKWYYNEQGEILHFPVDNYYYEGKRTASFLGEDVVKYHRTITSYVEGLLKNNLIIEGIVEPVPPKEMMDLPGMKDEMRRPMMLIISAIKG